MALKIPFTLDNANFLSAAKMAIDVIKNLRSEVEQTHESTKNMQDDVAQSGSAVQSVFQKMVAGAKAFIATGLGAVITLLGYALSALMTYFKGTMEGERQFAELSGYLSGIMQKVTNVTVELGRQLARLFTEPKEAMKDFGNALKENLLVRLKEIGKIGGEVGSIFRDIFKADWDSLKNHLVEFGDSWLTIATGVEDVRGKVAGVVNDAKSLAEAYADINKRMYDLNNRKGIWEQEKQKLESERARLLETSTEGNFEDRIAQMNKIVELNARIAEGDRKIAQEELKLTVEKNSLGDNNLEDTNAEREKQIALDRINEEEAAANRRIRTQITNLRKQYEKAGIELSAVQNEELRKLIRLEEDNEAAIAQAKIDAMDAGEARVRAQRELNHQNSMREIKRQLEDEITAARAAAQSAWEKDPNHSNQVFNQDLLNVSGADYNALTGNDKAIVDNYNRAVEIATQKSNNAISKLNSDAEKKEREAMTAYLSTYGNYLQQREALKKAHDEKLNQATTEGEVLEENARYDTQLADLEKKFTNTANKIVGIFGTINKGSKAEIDKMIKNLKGLIDAMSDKNLTDDEKFTFISEGLGEEFLNKVKAGTVTVNDLEKAVEDLEEEGVKLEGVFGKMSKVWKDFKDTGDISAFVNGLQECYAVASQAAGMVGELADAFGNSELKQSVEDVGNVIDKTLAGASVGASVGGGWGALAGAVVGLGTGLAQVFARKADDSQVEQIKELDQQIKRLTRSYEELQDKVDKTFATDKSKNIEEQIKNIQRQNSLIRQQIIEEESKKHTSEDAVEAYRDKLIENNRKIKELKEQAEDAIFGQDITTAIQNFAQAYADAWAQNENRTASAKEQVRQMMVQMVTEAIKAATEASGAMEKIRSKMYEFFKDGVFQDWEREELYKDAEALQKELDQKFSWADQLFDKDSDFTAQATKGAFSSMSSDQANELNGRFAASQIAIESILQNSFMTYNIQVALSETATDSNQVLKEVRNLMIGVAGDVEDIAANTKFMKSFGDKLDRMNSTLESKL